MEKILYILFGWLLGIGSSLLLRWNDKVSKTNEFKMGLKSELIETLPRMIKTVVSLKLSLGTLDHKSILWSKERLEKYHAEMHDEIIPDVGKMLEVPSDQIERISQYKAKILDAGTGKSLKKFELLFLEAYKDKVLLLNLESQKIIYRTISRFNLINQEVERYLFYFDKTFDPKSLEVNQETLQKNMEVAIKLISENLYLNVEDCIVLLSRL